MQTFAVRNEESLRFSSESAKRLISAWETTLGLRIASQKAVDLANRLPPLEHEFLSEQLPDSLDELLTTQQALYSISRSLLNCLQSFDIGSQSRLQMSRVNAYDNDDLLWKDIENTERSLEANWKNVLNKLHARVNFGSEKAKSKLKVFNSDMWTHIEDTLRNSSRQIEKSRVPLHESERIGLIDLRKKLEKLDYQCTTNEIDEESEDEQENYDLEQQRQDIMNIYGVHEEKEFDLSNYELSSKKKKLKVKKRKLYDLEVYDDRQFYSVLLKVKVHYFSEYAPNLYFVLFFVQFMQAFIQSHSSGSGSLTSSMRADDMEALRKYRRKKTNVDRKASKGRKIRYTVHDKLQNFMFPIPTVNPSTMTIDSSRLFASLFQ